MPRASRLAKWQEEADRRDKKFGHRVEPMAAQSGQSSLLEKVIVLDPGAEDYRLRVQAFEEWRTTNKLGPQSEPAGVLLQFLDFLDEMFCAGGGHSDGEKSFSGLLYMIPKIRQEEVLMARVSNALEGWSKRAPQGSRAPHSIESVMAVIGDMIAHGKILEAIDCLIQFLTTWRPGEIDRLLTEHLIQPPPGSRPSHWSILLAPSQAVDPRPGKTGEYDESVVLDILEFEWLNAVFQQLKRSRQPQQKLFPMTSEEISAAFAESANRLGLHELGLVRYGLRHASASWLLLNNLKTYEAVKNRGGWRTDTSMKRYAKAALVAKMASQTPSRTIEYGTYVMSKLREAMIGTHTLVPFESFRG